MAEIDTERLAAKMRAGLDGVTLGPWRHYKDRLRPQSANIINEVQCTDGTPVVAWSGFDNGSRKKTEHQRNAAHIARCDPGSIRALLTERQSDKARIAEIEAENDRLREALARAQRALADLINPSADPTAPNIMATYAQIFEAEVAARKALGAEEQTDD